jgi:hypothetical protein
MAKTHNAAPATRVESGGTEALSMVADREHYAIAKMVKGLIRDYFGRKGVTVAVQGARLMMARNLPTGTSK